jgi:hypothetical protein
MNTVHIGPPSISSPMALFNKKKIGGYCSKEGWDQIIDPLQLFPIFYPHKKTSKRLKVMNLFLHNYFSHYSGQFED